MKPLLVRDLMTSPVVTIRPHTRLPVIKQIMGERRVHRLPVVDGEQLLGIVTMGDVRNAFPSDLLTPDKRTTLPLDLVRASQLMRTELVTIAPDATAITAAALLLRHKISGLPVLAEQRLVGILTKSDLCRAILEGKLVPAPLNEHTSHRDREIFPYHPVSRWSSITGDTAVP